MPGRVAVLYRLFPVRGASQPDPGPVGARVWFARIMFHLGAGHPGPGLHPECDDVLRPAVPAGRDRGWVLPRRAYVLTLWYPQAHRARDGGSVHDRQRRRNAVGAALGGLLLDLDGLLGLAGWQWVFLVTGMPAVLLAPYVLWRLPDGPTQARWLPEPQKAWLAGVLDSERGGGGR